MATEWISPTWRMPNDKNQSKFENYSLNFDGSNQKIEVPTTALAGLSKFSLCFSVNIIDQASVLQYITAGSTANGFRVYFSATQITVVVGNAMFRGDTIADPFSEWTNYVITFDGTVYATGDRCRVWENNVELTPNLLASNVIAMPSYDTLVIGGQRTGPQPWYYYYKGQISQLSFFDYVLSESQVSYLANLRNPMAISGQPPIAYYPLGGSSTGSASTLTVPNESVPSATAFDFGASDYIDFGNDESLQITGAITLSMWVKMNAAGNQGFMSKSLTPYFGAANQKYFNIGVLNPDIYWQIGNGTIASSASYGFASYMDGNWHHVVGTFDGTLDPDNVRLYIDGVYVDSGSAAFDTIKGDSVYPLCISDRTKVYDSGMEMANAQIWDSNLTDGGVAVSAVAGGEIATLYNNGTPYTGTQPQAANLQGWWKMNVDTSTWNGSDWIIGEAQANYSSALSFDGSSTMIQISDNASLKPADYITVSCWAKFGTQPGTYRYIISKPGATTASSYAFYFAGGTTTLNFYVETPGSGLVLSPTTSALNDDRWHNIVGVYDGAKVRIYVDGSEIGSGTTCTGAIDYGTGDLYLGEYDGTPGNQYEGELSNVIIWDSVLSAPDVLTLYNNGTPINTLVEQPSSEDAQGWWKLDNTATWTGSAFSVPDASENDNTGTSSGMTESNLVNVNVSVLNGISDGMTTANLIPSNLTRSIPYSSYSMNFDGVNDSIALDSELSYSGEFSVSMWLYITDDTGGRVFLGNSTGGDGFLYIKAGVGHVLYIGSGDLATQFNNTAFTVNEWAHLAVTRDASDVFRAYKNGVLTDTSAADAGTFAFNQLGLYGTNSYEFEGNMCQVAAWSTTLSLTNVQTLYNYGVPNDISSLSPVSWWSLAGDSYYNGSDWICPDLGSGGNNGTSDGMGGTELVGNGPGSTANGIATSMDIPTNLKGEAPNSTSNAISINMTAVDRVTSVPG